jgi:hypothetical protein
MGHPADLIITVLREPAALVSLSLEQWDLLLPWARSTNLLGRIAFHALSQDIFDKLPSEPRWHLQAAAVACDCNQRAIRWQIRCIEKALAECETPVILLKGAAYLHATLPPAAGRLCADVDLLVDRAGIAQVEMALQRHGWKIAPIKSMDERYFRATLHELPPMIHPRHPGELDVHHNILPTTDPLAVDAGKLLAAAISLPQGGMFHILSPCDMVLHAASHLFRGGKFQHGLRDLLDLHDLVCHFSAEHGFWTRLTGRASELNLQIPCFWGMRYLEQFFGTPIPSHVQDPLHGWQPLWPPTHWMDQVVRKAVLPSPNGYDDRLRSFSHWLLAHHPAPRLSVMASPLFWLKRFQRDPKIPT